MKGKNLRHLLFLSAISTETLDCISSTQLKQNNSPCDNTALLDYCIALVWYDVVFFSESSSIFFCIKTVFFCSSMVIFIHE